MKKSIGSGTSIALGMCAGIVAGILFDEIAVGVALGPVLGIILHGLRTSDPATSGISDDDRP